MSCGDRPEREMERRQEKKNRPVAGKWAK
jgi:hypothetical protein